MFRKKKKTKAVWYLVKVCKIQNFAFMVFWRLQGFTTFCVRHMYLVAPLEICDYRVYKMFLAKFGKETV